MKLRVLILSLMRWERKNKEPKGGILHTGEVFEKRNVWVTAMSDLYEKKEVFHIRAKYMVR